MKPARTTAYRERGRNRTHRIVAEEVLGRPLTASEVVHHINGDKWDNRPENLEVLPSQAEHVRRHRMASAIVTDGEIETLILLGYSATAIARRCRVGDGYVVRVRQRMEDRTGLRLTFLGYRLGLVGFKT